jgi:hypothetical protein
MKKTLIIHPFLFGLFPILFLYSYNIAELPFTEILLPSAIVLGFTVVVFILLWLILKRDGKKSGMIASCFLILFFSYGRIYDLIQGAAIGTFIIGRHRYLMILWAVLFVLAVYFTIRTRKDLRNFTNILNIVAIVLVLFSLSKIAIYKINTASVERETAESKQEEIYELADQAEYPDIYYIILDGYASSNTLKEVYGYDNSEFDDYLSEKGFFIADKSISNYPMSFLSMASSLNIEYINYLGDELGLESDDRTIPHNMIEDNEVTRLLKSIGYQYIHFSSGWGPTNYNKYADLNIAISRSSWNDFQTLLIQTTMADAFIKRFFQDVGRNRVLNTFSGLADIYKIEGKKFVFSHIVCPHPPYLFNREGGAVPEAEFNMDEWGAAQKEYYLNQLIYINEEIKEMVDKILSESEIPPIIILQADHGPRNTFIEERYPTDDMFKEGMRILNALYIPCEGSSDLLYESMTPVNTFRVIFNSCFGMEYELLDDRSYNSFEVEPYRFKDITEIVDYD